MARKKSEASANRQYWLMKSEADCFSFDHLMKCPGRKTYWDGVRNYEARNLLRDQIKTGDGVLYYHSNSDPTGVFGIAEVVRDGYPDHTAFDPKHEHFDPKSDPDKPTWFMVDIRAVQRMPNPVTLAMLRGEKSLENMALFRRNRLSVTPVTEEEWHTVLRLGGLE